MTPDPATEGADPGPPAGSDAPDRPVRLDAPLYIAGPDAAEAARRLVDAGVDGAFTFEGPDDVFVPLARAAGAAPLDLYSNVAISFPRSPTHLAHTAWDLQRLTGGRFLLGLGSQVRAHVERRHGADFARPAARMADQVAAVHAVFEAWATGGPLDHDGPFWTLDLMPPLFRPHPLDGPPPPVLVAAVGPLMTEVACSVADGIVLHPFTSGRFLDESSLPAIDAALAAHHRSREGLTVIAGAMIAAGADDREQAEALEGARGLIAFYGSTPAYRPVLDAEGVGDLQPRLRDLTRAGRWSELPDLVDDDLVRRIAVCGSPAEVARGLRDRLRGRVDRVAMTFPYAVDLATVAAVTGAVRADD